jgi:predicted transposase YdaD
MAFTKEVEEAYQEWVKKRRAEGKVEGIHEGKIEGIREGKIAGKMELVNKMVGVRFGADVLTPEIGDRLHKLNEQQLDEFTSKIFEWQQLSDMVAWLENSSI